MLLQLTLTRGGKVLIGSESISTIRAPTESQLKREPLMGACIYQLDNRTIWVTEPLAEIYALTAGWVYTTKMEQ